MYVTTLLIDCTSITTYDGSATQSLGWKDCSWLGGIIGKALVVIVAMSSAHVFMEITSNGNTSSNDMNTLLESTVTYLNHSNTQMNDFDLS